MTKSTIGVDLGGTHVRAAVIDAGGTISQRVHRPTPVDDREPIVLVELLDEMVASSGIDRAVIGLPGVIDHEAEALVRAPNLPARWAPLLSDAWLSRRTGLEVSLANDADLAAVGESTFGAGQPYRDVVYVTISTGIGAGIVLGSRLMRGRYSGGEIGHTIVDRRLLAEGTDGTVEGLGSGTALAEAAGRAGLPADGEAISALVRDGDQAATAVWNEAIEAAGVGIVNVCWLVSPQVVVVGGGVGLNADLVLPVFRRLVADHGPAIEPIEIVTAALGDDAALSGAAAWWEAIGRD